MNIINNELLCISALSPIQVERLVERFPILSLGDNTYIPLEFIEEIDKLMEIPFEVRIEYYNDCLEACHKTEWKCDERRTQLKGACDMLPQMVRKAITLSCDAEVLETLD